MQVIKILSPFLGNAIQRLDLYICMISVLFYITLLKTITSIPVAILVFICSFICHTSITSTCGLRNSISRYDCMEVLFYPLSILYYLICHTNYSSQYTKIIDTKAIKLKLLSSMSPIKLILLRNFLIISILFETYCSIANQC